LKENDYPGLNNVMRNNPSSFLRDEEWPWWYSRFMPKSFSSYQNFLFLQNQFSWTFCLSLWAFVCFYMGFECFLLVSVFVRFNWFLFIYYPSWHCLLLPCVVHFMGNASFQVAILGYLYTFTFMIVIFHIMHSHDQYMWQTFVTGYLPCYGNSACLCILGTCQFPTELTVSKHEHLRNYQCLCN
jgi:hypothetical protein